MIICSYLRLRIVVRSILVVDFLYEEDFGGEVVGITSYPSTAGECAEGIAFVLAVLLLEEFLIDYHSVLELQAACTGEEVMVYDYLVE